MDDKTKHILMGLVIGIIIGMAVFYMLMSFRIIQPFLFSENRTFNRTFGRPDTLPAT